MKPGRGPARSHLRPRRRAPGPTGSGHKPPPIEPRFPLEILIYPPLWQLPQARRDRDESIGPTNSLLRFTPMAWHRFRIKSSWQQPPSGETASGSGESDYDFHAFCLEIMDVIWAWAFAGGVVLVLLFLL